MSTKLKHRCDFLGGKLESRGSGARCGHRNTVSMMPCIMNVHSRDTYHRIGCYAERCLFTAAKFNAADAVAHAKLAS